jgi:hypothetical protein
MPVVINEVDIVEPPAPQPPSGPPPPAARTEPLAEQFRRLQHDLEVRRRRRAAD